MSPLASNADIQSAIADQITSGLSDPLAANPNAPTGPLKAVFLLVVNQAVQEVVSSTTFQKLWDDANRDAHDLVDDLVEGNQTKNGTLAVEKGQVVLNLNPLVDTITQKLQARGLDVGSHVQLDPADAAFVLFDSPGLAKASRVLDVIQRLEILFLILMLLALIGYLALSPDRRPAIVWAGVRADDRHDQFPHRGGRRPLGLPQ